MQQALARTLLNSGVLVAIACSPGAVGRVVKPETPTASTALGSEAPPSCRKVPARAETLLVDLHAKDRLNLEEAMETGIPVAAYSCEGLRVLSGCKLGGGYRYVGVSRKEEAMQLAGVDELQVNLPFSGGKVGSDIERSSTLDVALVLVGKRTALREQASPGELVGACEGATHFVRSASIGAYALATGAKGHVKSVAEIFGVGASGQSTSTTAKKNRDGDMAACMASSPSLATPPEQCRSPIGIELVMIAPRAQEAPADAEKGKKQARVPGCPEGLRRAAGKCTSDASTVHTCAPDSLEECEAECGRGSGDSCTHLGLLLENRGDPRAISVGPDNPFEKGCAKNSPLACHHLAMVGRAGERRERFERMACDAGVGAACEQLAKLVKDARERSELIMRACRLGESEICYRYATDALVGYTDPMGHVDLNRDWALEMLGETCKGGDIGSCLEAGDLFEHGSMASIAPVGPRRERKMMASEPAKALAAYEAVCSRNYGEGCFRAGELWRRGLGVPKDAAKAASFYERGCDAPNETGSSCNALALLFDRGVGRAKDAKRSIALFEKACAARDRDACLALVPKYRSGGIVEKNNDRAFDLLERACLLAAYPACVEGGRAFERSDPERALRFYQAACRDVDGPESDPVACRAVERLGKGQAKAR